MLAVHLMQVAVQCLAPSVILLGCGMVMLQEDKEGMPGRPWLGGGSMQVLKLPQAFCHSIASFTAFFTCTCCCLYSALILMLSSAGILQLV